MMAVSTGKLTPLSTTSFRLGHFSRFVGPWDTERKANAQPILVHRGVRKWDKLIDNKRVLRQPLKRQTRCQETDCGILQSKLKGCRLSWSTSVEIPSSRLLEAKKSW